MNVPNPLDKGAPDAPDYQGAANNQTAANRANQYSPWASSTWTQGAAPGGTDYNAMLDKAGAGPFGRDQMIAKMKGGGPQGQWSQQIGLAPGLQSANDSLMSQFASANATPLDSGAGARQHAEDAIYGRASSRLDPQWQQRQHDFQTQLANQGLDPGSAAYSTAQGNFDRGRNDAYSSALMNAIVGGGQEGQRTQQMDLQRRMAPLSGMSGIQSLTGMPGIPQAGNSLAAAQMQGQAAMDRANYNRKFWADMIQGGAGLASGMSGGGGASPEAWMYGDPTNGAGYT